MKPHGDSESQETATSRPGANAPDGLTGVDLRALVSAVDGLKSALMVTDRDMRVVWHSQGIRDAIGRSMVGELCHEAVFGRSEICPSCLVKRTFETGEPQTGNMPVDFPGMGRVIVRVATSPITAEDGRVTHVLELVHNLQVVPIPESELGKYKRLIDTSDDYMAVVDEYGCFVVVNRKAVEDLGRSEDELIGRPWFDLVVESDRAKTRELADRARSFGIAAGNTRLMRKDGAAVPVYVSASFDPEQRIYEIVCRDVSEQLRMAEELQRRTAELEAQNQRALKAVQDKDRFCRIVSHELRTPLTSLIGFATMLLEDEEEPLTDRQRAKVERVADAARKLLDMVNGLLDLSRLDAGKVELELSRVAVGRFLEQVADSLRPLAEDKNLKLKVEVPADFPDIVTDQRMLRQIIVNLLSNAIKFTDRGGVRVTASKNGSNLYIAVEDTGIGIPAAELPLVFEEFHRSSRPESKRPGTGLGLAIARRLADLLGGQITVQSKENEGSTFTLVLPAPNN